MKTSGVLSRQEILMYLQADVPLVEKMVDMAQQVQPNGIDLTVKEIALLSSAGCVSTQNKDRVLSTTSPLVFDGLNGMDLMPGCYLVTFTEIVNLPRTIMALARPRSSLLRCGVSVHTAVWDAGYSGRSQALMTVYNPMGFRLRRYARIMQIVFFHLSGEVVEGYDGIFQGENIR
jgi:dUTP pyrophosphatase